MVEQLRRRGGGVGGGGEGRVYKYCMNEGL